MTEPPQGSRAETGPGETPEADIAPEISTRVVSVFFRYFEHHFGRPRTLSALARIGGLPSLEYVLHPENFVSLDYCVRVARVLTEESGDPQFLRSAGLYQLANPGMFGFVYYLMRSLGSPRLYYRTAVRFVRTFNRVCEMTIEVLTESRLRLRYRSLKPEGTRLMCEGRMGQLAAAPTLWGLPPAEAREVQCQILGAEACIYEFRWIPPIRPVLRALAGAAVGAVAGGIALGTRDGLWGAAVGALAVLAVSYRAQSVRKTRHILDAAEGAEKALEELRKRFEQVQELNAKTETSHRALLTELRHRESAEAALVEAQKLEAIGRLSGGIAHDFNNVVTVILNYADFARAGAPSSERVRESLDAISEAGRRAAQLTGQLLAFARRQAVEPRVLGLEDHVRRCGPMLTRLVGEDIRVEISLGPEPSNVLIDPGQLEQLLLNMAANARDAMPGGGTLRLETGCVSGIGEIPARPAEGGQAEQGPYALLAISDTGAGMDEATRRRVFEPFFTTKERGRGTGLGLASCHGIVHQAQGEIAVSSVPGGGTTFRIYLPRVLGGQDVTASPAPQPVRGGDETVLLVEDDAAVREIMVRTLRASGYRVLDARDGSQALAVADAARIPGPDAADIRLLVTDIVMPGLDGPGLAMRLRLSRPDLRVLFVSGYAHDVLERRGIALSNIHLLAKPFGVDDLARKVREVLDVGGTIVSAEHAGR